MKNVLRRFWVDLAIIIAILFLLATRIYENFPQPLALAIYKVLLVSLAFTHATLTRKLAFPKVDWNLDRFTPSSVLAIAIYVVFVYAYSIGG